MLDIYELQTQGTGSAHKLVLKVLGDTRCSVQPSVFRLVLLNGRCSHFRAYLFSLLLIFGINKDLLISFLNEVFKGRKHIQGLEYAKIEELGDGPEEGGAIFDLVCTGSDGEKFIIEVQRARQENFKKRALFYTSRLISNQAPKGRRSAWGYDITEVYLVALLDGFTVTDAADPHIHQVYLCEQTSGKVFYEGLGYIFIELKKFDKTESELQTDLDRWLFVLKNMSQLEKIPVYLRKTIFEKVYNPAYVLEFVVRGIYIIKFSCLETES